MSDNRAKPFSWDDLADWSNAELRREVFRLQARCENLELISAVFLGIIGAIILATVIVP